MWQETTENHAPKSRIFFFFTHRWADLGAIGATILIGPGFGAIGCKSAATLEVVDSSGTTLTFDEFFREAGPGRGLDKGPGPDC